MSYIRKTTDTWEIQGFWYGFWEVENIEFSWVDAKRSLKEYRENGGTSYRLIKKRVKNENL